MSKLVLFGGIATLMGTIVGAGILGLPYAIAKSGFYIGLLEIVLIGLIFLLAHLMFGEVMLRTKGSHQLPGYAKIYLGKAGKIILLIAMIFGIYGPLLAYLIGTGNALSAIFPSISPFVFSIIMFAILSVLVFSGLKVVEESEFGLMFILIGVILAISIWALLSGKFDSSFVQGFNVWNLFIPYGIIVFAFMGAPALPEVKEELKNHKHLLKKVIIWASLLPILIYVFFVFCVIGVTGASTTEIATIGLGNVLGPKMVLLGNLLAIFGMSTSFIALGLAMKEMYTFDLKMNKNLAWALTCSVPLILFLLGLNNFISVLSFTGAIAGGLIGILIVLMFWQAKKFGQRTPEYSLKKNFWLSLLIIIVFSSGIAYVFWF